MNFHGQIPYLKKGPYAVLIQPIIQLKKAFELIYHGLLRLFWGALIAGKRPNSNLLNPFVMLVFVVFSLVAYYLDPYNGIIIGGLFVLWLVDSQLAKSQYLNSQNFIKTSLEAGKGENDWVVWQLTKPGSKTQHQQFSKTQIEQIVIVHDRLVGGAFESTLTMVWQVFIKLINGAELLMYEDTNSHQTLDKAEKLGKVFKVPVRFLHSEGVNQYAAEKLDLDRWQKKLTSVKTIQVKKSDFKWHLYSRWDLHNTKHLLGQMFQRSGFLLFVLIMVGVMSRVGGLLVNVGRFFLGRLEQGIDFSLGSILQFFQPELGWFDLLSMMAVLGLMLHQGSKLSEPKEIVLGRNSLSVPVDKNTTIGYRIDEIKAILLLKQPTWKLLILDGRQSVEIDQLQNENEFRAMFYHLIQGIEVFHSGKQNRFPGDDQALTFE